MPPFLPFPINHLKSNGMLNLIKNDPWLEPFLPVIEHRHQSALEKEKELCGKKSTLSDFADGYLYFGLHRTEKDGWIIREWAPNATEIFLIGDFSDWKERPAYRFKPLSNGVWEIKLDAEQLHHLDLYKLSMHWEEGKGERVPVWATVSCKMKHQKSFRHRYGLRRNRISSKRKNLPPIHRLCSSTNAT